MNLIKVAFFQRQVCKKSGHIAKFHTSSRVGVLIYVIIKHFAGNKDHGAQHRDNNLENKIFHSLSFFTLQSSKDLSA